jgi:protein arginine kinase activator
MEDEDVKPEEKENGEKQLPDRPLECSECRKPVSVHYTEIVGNLFTHTCMCSECPQLQRKLKGTSHEEVLAVTGKGTAGIVCGECGTTLDNFRVSHRVGCSNCYEVFGDLIVEEMLRSNKISSSITKRKKSVPLHVGRTPGETQEISPSLRLIALNEALEETLQREDYEQAAWLRDQIKALTEDTEKKNASEG